MLIKGRDVSLIPSLENILWKRRQVGRESYDIFWLVIFQRQ